MNKQQPAELIEQIASLEDALYRILDTNLLSYAKEIAADALEEDLEEYLQEEEVAEIDLDDDTPFYETPEDFFGDDNY